MKRVTTIITVCMLITLAACKKEKSDSARMNLITTGTWKLVALTQSPGHDIDGDGIVDTDVFVFREPCENDNIYTFKKNGEYQGDEGPSKCDPSDPQIDHTTWRFVNNETEIIIDGTKGTIVELTASNLIIRGSAMGETYTFTYGR